MVLSCSYGFWDVMLQLQCPPEQIVALLSSPDLVCKQCTHMNEGGAPLPPVKPSTNRVVQPSQVVTRKSIPIKIEPPSNTPPPAKQLLALSFGPRNSPALDTCTQVPLPTLSSPPKTQTPPQPPSPPHATLPSQESYAPAVSLPSPPHSTLPSQNSNARAAFPPPLPHSTLPSQNSNGPEVFLPPCPESTLPSPLYPPLS